VAASAGPACASALREVTRQVDRGLAHNATALKQLFGADQVLSPPLVLSLFSFFGFF